MLFPKFLRVAVVPLDGLVSLKETEDGNYKIIGGPEGELVKLCAQALKFSYKILPAPDKKWGNIENGSWTGAIGMVHRNEADIGISKFGMSLERSQYIEYSYPYIIELFTFGTEKPGLRAHIDAIIQPFNLNTWIITLITVVILSLCLSFFEKMRLVESIQKIFEILISHSTKIIYYDIWTNILLSTWIVGSLFLSYCYMAVLLSFMTVPVLEKVPENIEELAEAVQAGTYEAITFRGAMVVSGLQNNQRESIRFIAKHIENNNNFVEHNRSIILQTMKKKKVALICPGNVLKLLLQHDFFMSQDFFKIHETAIILSKRFCCKKKIDDFVHRISASGIYRKLLDDEIFIANMATNHLDYTPAKTEKPISLMDMSGAFVLILIGHSLAIIVALAEIAYFKILDKRMNRFVRI